MIVNSTPITTKKDSINCMSSTQALKHQSRMNNNSNCFSEPKHNPMTSKAKNHSQSSKSHQQNHHTLQCISDINDFKQKINMVLQTQAFPNKLAPQVMESIPTKQLVGNAPGSLNPSSRIGYQNNKHESPTPNLNKSQFFQKRKVNNKQNGLNQLGQIYDITDSKNEQIINSAFQSFKQNLKQQHQQFIKSTNSQGPGGTLMDQHQAQVHDSRSQGNNLQEQSKFSQSGGTYLLRNQKEKNRNQFQLQQANGQMNQFQSNGEISKGKEFDQEIPHFKIDSAMHQKMLNGQLYNQGQPITSSMTQKGILSNMINQPLGIYQQTSANEQDNIKSSQRRKLLLEYGQEIIPENNNKQNGTNNQSSPEPNSAGSRHKRSSVYSQGEPSKKRMQSDFFESLQSLNFEILEEKDRESLKQFSQQYLADLKEYLELKNEYDDPTVNGKLLTDLASQHLLNSREGGLTQSHKSAGQNAVVPNNELSKETTPTKQPEALEVEPDDSAEKFKQNEKNLKEERLHRESNTEFNLKPADGPSPKLQLSSQKVTEDDQQVDPSSQAGEQSQASKLNKNSSQRQILPMKTSEITETETSILFRTENNRLKQMLESHNIGKDSKSDDGACEEIQKIRILNKLLEELEKPRVNLNARGSNILQVKGYMIQSQDNKADLLREKRDTGQPEWMQGILPIQLFLASLNCPKPSPQQINVMNNSKQRLDLFKILQAREHVKFTNIQSEKMLQLHQKLDTELELKTQNLIDFKTFDPKSAEQKKQELMNFYQQKQIQQMNNLQQLKNLRKQQQNDQKAFSIFQMNELSQFRSMSDGQQKQILLNNLQQGKFDEFENLLDPITVSSNKTQASQSTADGTSINNSSKLSKIGGRTMEQSTDIQKKQRNIRTTVDEQSKGGIDMKADDTKIIVDGSQRRSMMTSGQETGSKENISGPGSVRMIRYYKNNIQSEQVTQRPSNANDSLHVIRKKDITQIKSNFEASESKFKSILKEQMLKQQKIKIFYQQMGEAFINYIHTNKFYQQIQSVSHGMENILPYLPRGTLTSSTNHSDFDERTRQRIKARQSMGLSNIAGQKAIDRTKSKQAIGNGKEDKAGEKKKEEVPAKQLDTAIVATTENKDPVDKIGEQGEGGEEPIQEPKKPRYFPPKKLPNPFENAAQEQEKFLQARKEALAKYSQISKNRFKQDESAPLKYVIRPGNNSKIIQRVFEKSGRLDPKCDNEGNTSYPGWETADDYYDSLYNFKWKPTSAGIKFDLIGKHGLKQLVNHIKGHYQLTTKDNLFINLKAYYESQKQNIYDLYPLTIVLDYLKDDVGDRVETFYNIMKLVEKNLDQDCEQINNKLQEMQIQREKSVKSQYKITRCMHDRQNLWLLKPTGFNRGIGIHIFQNFDQLKDIMQTYYGIGRGQKDKVSIFQTHKQNHVAREYIDQNGEKQHRNFSFVIQKLIERPLLYLNRKFDIRTLVLMTSADGKVYQYRESYVRTSSKEYQDYDPDQPFEEQIFMQLTNNAVQKEGADYGKFEEGNIISLDTLFHYVSKSPSGNGQTKLQLKEQFLSQSERFIIDSIKSIKGKIAHQKFTFELFGYDFIIDEDLNTYLIEVNTNPCLEESNRILKNMLPRLVDDMLNITMDPLFFPAEANRYRSVFPLPGSVFTDLSAEGDQRDCNPHPGFKDTENLFKHIFTLEQ